MVPVPAPGMPATGVGPVGGAAAGGSRILPTRGSAAGSPMTVHVGHEDQSWDSSRWARYWSSS